MDLNELLEKRSIKKYKASFSQIKELLEAAVADLKTAQANLDIDPDWSMNMAYSAMLASGIALMYFQGYRPSGQHHHKSVVDFTTLALEQEHAPLLQTFERMRRRRSNMLYRAKRGISKKESSHSIETAQKLLEVIKNLIS